MTKLVLLFLVMAFAYPIFAQNCPVKTEIDPAQLPIKAVNYLSQYKARFIDDYDMYATENGKRYSVEFEDENPYFIEEERMMIFDEVGNLLLSESEVDVTGQTMPSALTNYMSQNYPGKSIRNIEMIPIWNGSMAYEVKNVESRDKMFFSMEGTMICIEVLDK